jgi:hypothetical protein
VNAEVQGKIEAACFSVLKEEATGAERWLSKEEEEIRVSLGKMDQAKDDIRKSLLGLGTTFSTTEIDSHGEPIQKKRATLESTIAEFRAIKDRAAQLYGLQSTQHGHHEQHEQAQHHEGKHAEHHPMEAEHEHLQQQHEEHTQKQHEEHEHKHEHAQQQHEENEQLQQPQRSQQEQHKQQEPHEEHNEEHEKQGKQEEHDKQGKRGTRGKKPKNGKQE